MTPARQITTSFSRNSSADSFSTSAETILARPALIGAANKASILAQRYGGDLRPGRPALSRGNHIDDEEAARIATEVDAMIGATAH